MKTNDSRGGAREGAGRKATGRERTYFYVSPDEADFLKKVLVDLRNEEMKLNNFVNLQSTITYSDYIDKFKKGNERAESLIKGSLRKIEKAKCIRDGLPFDGVNYLAIKKYRNALYEQGSVTIGDNTIVAQIVSVQVEYPNDPDFEERAGVVRTEKYLHFSIFGKITEV